MANYPDGTPKIPNPIPGTTPQAPQMTRVEATRASVRSFLIFASIESIFLIGIVLITFVFPLVSWAIGIALLLAVALVSAICMLAIIRRNTTRIQAADDAHDAAVSAAPPAVPGTFRLPVEDVFAITGRGTVVTGTITSGRISTEQMVHAYRNGQTIGTYRVTGIETFRKHLTTALAGDRVGLLLDSAKRDDFQRGDEIRD